MNKTDHLFDKYKKEGSGKKSLWRILASMMAVIVTFVTTYSLILPAITASVDQFEEVPGLYLDEEDYGYEIVEDKEEMPESSFWTVNESALDTGMDDIWDEELIENDDLLIETESELEEAGINPAPEIEIEPDYQVETGTAAEAETEVESESETKITAETEIKAEPETGTETETEFAAETETEFAAETEAEAEPETEVQQLTPAQVFYDRAEGIRVIVNAPEGTFPEGTTMTVNRVEDEEILQGIEEAAVKENTRVTRMEAVDICFIDKDGEKIEPQQLISVRIVTDVSQPEEEAVVVHMDDNGQAETLSDASVKTKGNSEEVVSFEAEHFSVYAIVYTVDFEYSVNGKMYQFSLPGDEKIALSDLLEVLGIIGDTNFDTVDEFIAAVETVEFSDSSLVAVSKVEKDTTFSAIEEDAYRSLGDNWMDATINGTSDPVIDDETIMAGDWLLTSLSPFTSEEELHIYTNDKVEHIINVSDEQHNVSNGEWAFEHKDSGEEGDYDVNNGTLDASLSRTVTSTPQERNVTFTMSLDYNLTSEAVAAIKDFHDGYPVLTYDLTEWLEQNPVDLSDTSGRLRAGNTTVGTYTVENGIVKLKITNLQWLHTQNRLDGTFTLKLTVNEEKLGTDDEWEFQLPNTDEPFKITFKEQEYKTTKTYQIDGDDAWDGAKIEKDEDGNYYINYTATINSPSKMDSLQFIDTLSSNQELVGNVTVTSPTGQNLTTTKDTTSTGFTVDISTTDDSGKLSAGTYTVSYRTKLTDEAVQQLENGNYTTDDPVTNNSDWKINGTKEIDGPSTELQPKKDPPQPDPPVKTVNGKTGDVGKFTYGQTLNYTLTYGSEGISLNGTTISDTMSALQNLVGNVTITYADGTSETMPTAPHGYDQGEGVVWNSADQPQYTGYSEGEKTLFNYTFTEDKEGPVTITYSTQVLSESDAEALNLFGTKDVRNTFVANNQSSWTVGHVDTQEPTQISKTVANKNGSSSYNPGDTVTYTVEYGKAGQNMSGITLLDSMTDIQELTSGITITFGDGSTVTLNSGDTGYVWNNDGVYSTGNTDVLNYTVENGKTGIITVTYDAKIISEETGNRIGLWGTQPLNNHASSSKGGSADTHKDIDFGQKPEPEVHKTANNLTTSSGNWQPGDEIEWTITYINDEKDMNGMVLEDYMNYLQTYVEGSAKISINNGAAVDMPASYLTYNTEGKTYGKDTQIQVYHFVVDESVTVHSVTITYKTKIIDSDDALANYVSGTVYVYNHAIGEDEHDDDGHDTDFPTIPVDKEVTEENGTESIDGKTWAVGDTVKFTMTYGAAGMQMNNAWIYDQMTDLFSSIGTITIKYYDEDGTEQSFTMPESGAKFSDDGSYNSYNKVDVFDYTMPGEDSAYGKIYGPLTITYEATLIDQETATDKGIGGTITVSNDFRTNVGADTVTGYVPYTSNSHDGKISKTGYLSKGDGSPVYDVDVNYDYTDLTDIPSNVTPDVAVKEHQVVWHIRVEAEEGSAYPLTNLRVWEDRGNFRQQVEGQNQSVGGNTPDLIDFASAKVITDSGVVLAPGADYTYSVNDKSWYFDELNEPVTIEVTATFPQQLVGYYFMSNHVYLKYGDVQKEDESTVKGNVDDITVKKEGTYDSETGLVTWKVYLNPAIMAYVPDVAKVIFKDDLPEGLELVNYQTGETENPSIYVDYPGTSYSSGCKREIGVDVTDGHFEADVSAFELQYNVPFTVTQEVQKYVQVSYSNYITKYNGEALFSMEWVNGQQVYSQATIPSWEQNGGDPITLDYWKSHSWYTFYVYTTVTEQVTEYHDVQTPVGINGLIYEITYKTRLADGEWDNITSSETGSKTYVNNALFTDEDTTSWSGEGEVTVTSENPLDKFEVQDRNEGSGNAPDWYKINEIDGATEDTDRLYWYQLEVNPNAEQLNHKNGDGSLNPLKLTDYIDTKIDIIPTSIQILEVTNGTERDTSNDAEAVRPVATYNGDSRLLTIANLQDKTHYTIRYKVRVRALYTPEMDDPSSGSYHEYIVSNTATLEGGGFWSDTTTGTHKAQEDGATISGGIQLTKINENDATETLAGAVFELYELETGVVVTTDTDGNVTAIDQTGILDEPVVTQVVDETDPDGDGEASTYTSKEDGSVDFGKNLKANTLYYWIETEFPEGYLGDTGIPHYFVIYYEEYQNETLSSGIHSAWELDDIWTAKYGYKIASISGGTTWVANNSKTRSISITKNWAGDYNNTYKTRPESVTVDLIQVKEDGSTSIYDTATLRADKDGNWLANTNYVWTNLPATYEEDGVTKYYTYTVSEETVPGYFATYSNSEPITTGSISITNTLIPSKTDIVVEKVWEGDEASERPNYIEAQLMQILTDSDGNKGTPTAYGEPVKLMLGTDGKWTYSWADLPTKSSDGGTYSYTVQEVNVPDGYAVSYSDNGQGVLKSTESDPLTITNTGLGSLKVSKELQGLEFSNLTTAQKRAIIFTVVDQSGKTVASFTLNDMGASLAKTIDNLPAGTYTVTETVPDESVPEGYNQTSVTYSIDGGVTTVVKNETTEVTVTNNYEKKAGSLKITKNVTVNDQAVTDTSMDGTYSFTITDSAGNLLRFVKEDDSYVLSKEKEGNLTEVSIAITNGTSNTVEVKGLEPGQYTVTEVFHSSTGITPDKDDVSVTVVAGKSGEEVDATAIAEITNNKTTVGGYELPSTGGPGTRLFTILGSILILLSGTLLWRRRRWV